MTPQDGAPKIKVESDERATALLGYCPHCPIHEGIRSYRQLVELTREFRQCPQCLRTYYVPVAAPPASPAPGAPENPNELDTTDGETERWTHGEPTPVKRQAATGAPDIPALIARLQAHHAYGKASDWDTPTGQLIRDAYAALTALSVRIEQHRGALGYSVPGDIPEDPSIKNGIAEALHQQLTALSAEPTREWWQKRSEYYQVGMSNLHSRPPTRR
jgi:hypothetical protein